MGSQRMQIRRWMMMAGVVGAVVAGTARLPSAGAGGPAVKRTGLARHDLGVKDREVVVTRGEFPAGVGVPRHTHPGDESAYVLEGALTVELDGKPAVTVKA